MSETVSAEDVERVMPASYMEYKMLVTPSEVPTEFHPFCYLAMLAAMARGVLWFREGNDTVYCNLWTLCIGSTTVPRKTTAIRPAVSVLKSMDGVVHELASRGSPEGFLHSIRDKGGTGYFHHPELGTLLAAMKRDYASGLADELCQYYEPGVITKRLVTNKKDVSVEVRAISWIACVTPSSLNACLSEQRIAGGFLPRWCVVFGHSVPERVPFRPPKDPKALPTLAQALLKSVMRFGDRCEFVFGQGARDTFAQFYNEELDRPTQNEFLPAFRVRALEDTKKVAVLLTAYDPDTEADAKPIVVPQAAMERAVTVGQFRIANAEWLLEREIALTYDERLFQRVRKAYERILADEQAEAAGRKPTKDRPTKPTMREFCRRLSDMRKNKLQPYVDTFAEREGLAPVKEGREEVYRPQAVDGVIHEQTLV